MPHVNQKDDSGLLPIPAAALHEIVSDHLTV
jgi:hypothetical protein